MSLNYADKTGLNYVISKIKTLLNKKVDKKSGYSLVSDSDVAKLQSLSDGVDAGSITFGDNTITEVRGLTTITTTFNTDGSITEVYRTGNTTKTKKTIFNADGNITITVT